VVLSQILEATEASPKLASDFSLLFLQLHRHRIPIDHLLRKVTLVASQRRPRRTESNFWIFNRSLATFADVVKEIQEVQGMSVFPFGRFILDFFDWFGLAGIFRIFGIVLFYKLLLGFLRESEKTVVTAITGCLGQFLFGQG